MLYAIGVFDSSYNAFVSYFTMNLYLISSDQFHSQLLTYKRRLDTKTLSRYESSYSSKLS